MKIELDDLTQCKGCGIVFNYVICGKRKEGMDYQRTPYWIGKCPICQKAFNEE